MSEPTLKYATIRDAVDELHIECRMSDGQKGAFITVDAAFPELAERVLAALTACNGISTARLQEYIQHGGLSKALWERK